MTTHRCILPDLPVADLVGELRADVEGEEEDGRAVGPRVHQPVGEHVALRHAAQQEVQVGDQRHDEHQRRAGGVDPPPGGGREVGALFE